MAFADQGQESITGICFLDRIHVPYWDTHVYTDVNGTGISYEWRTVGVRSQDGVVG